ncbi:hypothetical protein DSL72_003711 [Monilinia vaccinii-corymbosi]|uniref:NADH:ubiquinone oxidoreductase 20.1kD subunit n=1 Tax=Monilinia vaccinii-corymbosi TaxID=61207 RepID=A0A8A3NYN3_9HELO|nr:hypothetical protein DSL72_003711 [Monilinia vaccinii-corymbosi]
MPLKWLMNNPQMFSRRIAAARPLRTSFIPRQTALIPQRCASQAAAPSGPDYPHLSDIEDPGMNGGYINPPKVKRQFRDPYADWWDKQERRNYGEPVHEDNDILGLFSPEEYTHQKPGTAVLQLGAFVATVFGLCTVVRILYPDRPSAPREFEGGLERELGGPTAVRVSYNAHKSCRSFLLTRRIGQSCWRSIVNGGGFVHMNINLSTFRGTFIVMYALRDVYAFKLQSIPIRLHKNSPLPSPLSQLPQFFDVDRSPIVTMSTQAGKNHHYPDLSFPI